MGGDRRVALVTGATSGIGVEIARRLAADGLGVVHTGRWEERAVAVAAEIGEGAVFLPADITEPSAADALVEAVVSAHGRIDVLVNNAAIDHIGWLLDTPAGGVRATFETNVFAAVACLQAAGRAMRDAGRGGAIINVTSRLASVGVPTMSIYSASKGAMLALTIAAAVELAPVDIRVNAVAPGMTRTPLYEQWLQEQADPAAMERRGDPSNPPPRDAKPRPVPAPARLPR